MKDGWKTREDMEATRLCQASAWHGLRRGKGNIYIEE
jgi:hypothetical protein